MSLSDEIERLKKEEENRKKQYQEQQEERKKEEERQCEESLNIFSSKHYKNVVQQSEFFINKIKTLEILNILVELRQIANLTYEHRTETIVKQVQTSTLFGSKSTNIKERRKVPVPAKIVVSTKGIFGSRVYVDDINSNWSDSFSNPRPSLNYYSLKRDFIESGHSKVDKNFLNYLNNRLKEIDNLKKPMIQGFDVEMLWNYEYWHDTDISATPIESKESLTISIEKNNVRIHWSNNKHQFPSIRLVNCTSQWIRKEIAEAHVKYNFQ